MSKVVVLCIDSAEYKLIKKYNLKEFKQKEYGKIEVPISSRFGMPSSPQVWASFIKGEWIQDTLYFNEFRNSVLNFFDKKINFIPIRKFAKKFIKRDKPVKLNDTIFERIKNSKAISVPCYNEYRINEELRKLLGEVLRGKIKEDKFIQLIERELKIKKRAVLNALKKNYNLIVVHIYSLDIIQHYFGKDVRKILEFYKIVSSLISEVKKRIRKDDLLLIISDHGQLNGMHTNYGFYSINKKMNLGTPRISDFFYVIKNWIDNKKVLIRKKRKIISHDLADNFDKEKIRKKLEELGYF